MKDLKELNKPLAIDQIEFRAAQAFPGKNGKKWVTLLAFKNARTDANILDSVVGPENWQLKFREEKGITGELSCVVASLGIRKVFIDGKDKDGHPDSWAEWVWKEGNGTPGDFEKEKGAYSDAQKRAGFQWGIGRGLYDFPQIFVELLEGEYKEEGGKIKTSASFRPQDWDWNVKYKTDGSVEELTASFKNNLRFNYKAK